MADAVLIVEALLGALIVFLAIQYFTITVKNVPGPWLAKFTNVWNFIDVWRGISDDTHRYLHKKYGPAVQYGPGRVSLSDPSLIKTIYSTKEKWMKSKFYSVNDVAAGRGQVIHTLFSARDEEWHTVMTKPFNKLYTMNSVLRFESQVNETIDHLVSRLNELFVAKGKPCSIDEWLHFYAWDVIGKVTFSRELGFLDQGKDIDNLINTGQKAVDYFCLISQMPFLDQLFDKNPVYRVGPPSFGAAAAYGAKQMYARISGEDEHDPDTQVDFLDLFLDLRKTDPEVDDNRLIAYLMSNVVAGSDTTAIELRAVVYFLCKHPNCKKRLQDELDAAGMRNASPKAYKDVNRLLYLDAAIRESMRLHPAVGMVLERIVPSSGLQLPDGRFLPAGTIVGMNPMVVNRNEGVYGAEPDTFNPERWLHQKGESQPEFEARTHRMKEADLTFGYGKRMCSGRHVAVMEIYKVMATLFAAFDMKLVDPQKNWSVRNSFFVRQWGFDVWLEPRC